MRLGLSNKITQPVSVTSIPITPGVQRQAITLYVKANAELTDRFGTYSRKAADGSYYGVNFPGDWDDLNTTTGAISNDPFGQYRVIKPGETNYKKFGNIPGFFAGPDYYALSPIDAHLDVTIIVDQDVNVGSNTAVLGVIIEEAMVFDISSNIANLDPEDDSMAGFPDDRSADNGGRWGSRFTIDAAKNLKVTVKNSGNVCGGGGYGGHGGFNYNPCGGSVSGGSGGGGAGNHSVPPTVGSVGYGDNTNTIYNNFGRAPGQEGDAFPNGVNGIEGGAVFGGSGGASGVININATDNPNGKPGERGGPAFQNWNGGLYALDTTAFATAPEYTIINEQLDDGVRGGYIYGGCGGGGGGKLSTPTGGAGGGYVDADHVISAGEGLDTAAQAAGGAAGLIEGTNFGVAVGGMFIFTNNHDTGNTQVTMQGNDGTY